MMRMDQKWDRPKPTIFFTHKIMAPRIFLDPKIGLTQQHYGLTAIASYQDRHGIWLSNETERWESW